MDPTDLAKLQLDAWKTTIQVQQHFNDIEMRIRALAITVLTAVLGAAALAINNDTTLDFWGRGVSLGTALLVIGVVTWMLFYFVDQMWYHRLLYGAVEHGEALEKILASTVPGIRLTQAISEASPYQVRLPLIGNVGKPVRSTRKIRFFYLAVALLLVAAAVFSALGTLGSNEPTTDGVASALSW